MDEGVTLDEAGEADTPFGGGPITLDPFAFFGDTASTIGGLGGATPPAVEGYAFHTPYSDYGAGFYVFVVSLKGLVATAGSLSLIVLVIAPRPNAIAHPIEIQTWDLKALATEEDPRIVVPYEALRGLTYGLFAQITGATDAVAEGLTVELWLRSDLERETERTVSVRRTPFQATGIRAVAQLVSGTDPTLSDPVSQAFTAGQLDEPVHAEWLARLGLAGSQAPEHWGETFILQALHRYGLLEPQARGLGFGESGSALPAVMAVIGCTVIAGGGDDVSLDALRRPAICDDALFDTRVSHVPVDPLELPGDMTDFDFVWSLGLDARLGSAAAVERFVDQAIRAVKPGGMAVHVFNHRQAAYPDAADAPPPLGRRDIDRLALSMISRGHEVAQLKYGAGTPAPKARKGAGQTAAGMFGFIVRRNIKG